MNDNETMFAGILMLFVLMLIPTLLNLNTGYADTDADLCIRVMSLGCNDLLKCMTQNYLQFPRL